MPTFKPVTKYKRTDGKYRIFIRVSHRTQTNFIPTEFYTKNPQKITGKLNMAIQATILEYENIVQEQGPAIGRMDLNTLLSRLRNKDDGKDFIKYVEKRIAELKDEGRFAYAESYKSMLKNLKRVISAESLEFSKINLELLRKFEHYLKVRGASQNTIRIYTQSMRAIFNHALDHDVINLPSPFRRFRVKVDEVQKRPLDVTDIQKLMVGPYIPAVQRSTDLFMLIFYLIGINLKDLIYAKPDNIHKGRLLYKRFKTGTQYSIKLVPEALALIEKYKGEKYLLNFMDEDDSFEHYKNFLKETNKKLKTVAKINRIESLSTYFARHSWATIAQNLGISSDDVAQALGHNVKKVTNLYITYSLNRIDTANRKVIDTIIAPPAKTVKLKAKAV